MIAARRAGIALLAIPIILTFAAAQAVCGEERAPPAASAAAAACQRADFRVVIDVGHTVEVPGAISARGVPEYAFNLRLGEAARTALIDAGFAKSVLLITNAAPPLGLLQRAMRANHMAADLFLAIHHDSVPDYLLQNWEYQGQQEHFNDSYPGYAIFISNDNAKPRGSLMFARRLGGELQSRGLGYTPHYTLALMRNRRRELVDADAGVYRYDQLVVLKDTRMPAVLLEAGSIVNRREELALASPQRLALESAAIAAAVEDFCAARASRREQRPLKRTSASAAAARWRRANVARLPLNPAR